MSTSRLVVESVKLKIKLGLAAPRRAVNYTYSRLSDLLYKYGESTHGNKT